MGREGSRGFQGASREIERFGRKTVNNTKKPENEGRKNGQNYEKKIEKMLRSCVARPSDIQDFAQELPKT